MTADPNTGNFFATFQRVDNDANRELPPANGGYGSVVDGNPRIEPRVAAPCGTHYATFDGGPNVFSGASGLAYAPASGLLWVAHQFTDNVAVLRCPVTAPASTHTPLHIAAQPHDRRDEVVPEPPSQFSDPGQLPRGIALTSDGHSAFVDDAFDFAVSRFDLTDASSLGTGTPPIRDATLTLRRNTRAISLSSEALCGASLFFPTATNPHLTPKAASSRAAAAIPTAATTVSIGSSTRRASRASTDADRRPGAGERRSRPFIGTAHSPTTRFSKRPTSSS